MIAVGQTVEVLFDEAGGQVWKQGIIVFIGPNTHTGVFEVWVELNFHWGSATLPYTAHEFRSGIVRVTRVRGA